MFAAVAHDVAGGGAMFAPGAGTYTATANANGVTVTGFA